MATTAADPPHSTGPSATSTSSETETNSDAVIMDGVIETHGAPSAKETHAVSVETAVEAPVGDNGVDDAPIDENDGGDASLDAAVETATAEAVAVAQEAAAAAAAGTAAARETVAAALALDDDEVVGGGFPAVDAVVLADDDDDNQDDDYQDVDGDERLHQTHKSAAASREPAYPGDAEDTEDIDGVEEVQDGNKFPQNNNKFPQNNNHNFTNSNSNNFNSFNFDDDGNDDELAADDELADGNDDVGDMDVFEPLPCVLLQFRDGFFPMFAPYLPSPAAAAAAMARAPDSVPPLVPASEQRVLFGTDVYQLMTVQLSGDFESAASVLFESPLFYLIRELKSVFSISDHYDISFEFPQLSLTMHQDLPVIKTISLRRLSEFHQSNQLRQFGGPAADIQTLRLVMIQHPNSLAKQLEFLALLTAEGGLDCNPIVLDSEADEDEQQENLERHQLGGIRHNDKDVEAVGDDAHCDDDGDEIRETARLGPDMDDDDYERINVNVDAAYAHDIVAKYPSGIPIGKLRQPRFGGVAVAPGSLADDSVSHDPAMHPIDIDDMIEADDDDGDYNQGEEQQKQDDAPDQEAESGDGQADFEMVEGAFADPAPHINLGEHEQVDISDNGSTQPLHVNGSQHEGLSEPGVVNDGVDSTSVSLLYDPAAENVQTHGDAGLDAGDEHGQGTNVYDKQDHSRIEEEEQGAIVFDAEGADVADDGVIGDTRGDEVCNVDHDSQLSTQSYDDVEISHPTEIDVPAEDGSAADEWNEVADEHGDEAEHLQEGAVDSESGNQADYDAPENPTLQEADHHEHHDGDDVSVASHDGPEVFDDSRLYEHEAESTEELYDGDVDNTNGVDGGVGAVSGDFDDQGQAHVGDMDPEVQLQQQYHDDDDQQHQGIVSEVGGMVANSVYSIEMNGDDHDVVGVTGKPVGMHGINVVGDKRDRDQSDAALAAAVAAAKRIRV